MIDRHLPGLLFQDWNVNRHSLKPRLVLLSYRAARHVPAPWRLPVRVFHRFAVEWVLGVELPWTVDAGPRLVLFHGQGLVVHPGVVLGSDCVLRHGVTLGKQTRSGGVPHVGDGVVFGAHALAIGPIEIGDGAVVGAGAVVTNDVPAGSVMIGNPARELRAREVGAASHP